MSEDIKAALKKEPCDEEPRPPANSQKGAEGPSPWPCVYAILEMDLSALVESSDVLTNILSATP